jgi:tetratricopeptide (TPR) repeat protein
MERVAPYPWEVLDRDEVAAMAVLGVFVRPATLEAFEAIASPWLERDPVDVAEALLRKGFATLASAADPASATGAERIRPADAACGYAREMLAVSSKREPIEDAHASYFLERAERACAESYGTHAERALDELHADAPDLLAAFASVRARAPDKAARIGLAVGDLALFREGSPETGGVGVITPLAAIFADARQAADQAGDAVLRARTRIVYARVQLELGRGAEAERSLLEAVALAEAACLPDAAADARRALGWAWLAAGRKAEAAAVLDEALRHHRETGHVRGEADALAARGLVACLLSSDPSGDRSSLEQGQRRLEVAHALHRGAGDRLRRAKVVEMARLVGLDLEADSSEAAPLLERARLLRASAAAHRAAGRLWREALDLFRLAELEEGDDSRRALLDTARRAADAAGVPPDLSAALAGRRSGGARETGAQARRWSVGPSARWLDTPGGARVSLARHGSMRRVLDALVARRLDGPGVATTADELLATGWPGERVRYESGLLRVYTTIRRLRRLGLEGVLLTRDDGYLLDPHAVFVRGDAGGDAA